MSSVISYLQFFHFSVPISDSVAWTWLQSHLWGQGLVWRKQRMRRLHLVLGLAWQGWVHVAEKQNSVSLYQRAWSRVSGLEDGGKAWYGEDREGLPHRCRGRHLGVGTPPIFTVLRIGGSHTRHQTFETLAILQSQEFSSPESTFQGEKGRILLWRNCFQVKVLYIQLCLVCAGD